MKKPKRRQDGDRRSDNMKRKLMENPGNDMLRDLANIAKYEGRGKHKMRPRAFGLDPEDTQAADRTTCDGDAGFRPEDMPKVRYMMQRGIQAGLVGPEPMRIVWAVSEDGWIFEARITNLTQRLYHGYPVRVGESFAENIILRYVDWANATQNEAALRAARAVCTRYAL